ncbi:hypothetical protein C8J57DRAFT_111059 [Mycena rebaudengoi]|nr:hypothetical protein C8J57DRAFT_111059 [Mycena rebaudengoi]
MAAVFPNAQRFIITGSVFNNTAISGTTETPSDFREILLGELKLLHEIKVEKGMADRRRSCGQPSLRRMYTAQIYGGASFMTAATYHGSDAEKRWREDIATYSRIRHPCFLQLYATVESGQLYVSIFHDDLIDIGHVRRLYHHSGIACVYLKSYISVEFQEASNYFHSVFGIPLASFQIVI